MCSRSQEPGAVRSQESGVGETQESGAWATEDLSWLLIPDALFLGQLLRFGWFDVF